MTLLEIAERFPPSLCRFVARKSHGQKPMSHSDLAQKSGLSRSYVAIISLRSTWKGIPIDVVQRFSEACGVNLVNPQSAMEFIRRAKKVHIQQCDANQKRFFAKLFVIRRESQTSVRRLAA